LIDVDGCHYGFGVTEGFKVSHDVAFPARRVSGWTIMAGWADFEAAFVASGLFGSHFTQLHIPRLACLVRPLLLLWLLLFLVHRLWLDSLY